MDADILFKSAAELAVRIRGGDLSPVDVVDAYLERIAARNDRTNAFVTVLEDDARERAQATQRRLDSGDAIGPLCGVPVAIKDLFATKTAVRHTYGSKVFDDNIADETAPVVNRLEDAGAIVLGKTNTPEFGWGAGKTENPVFGQTVTPFDLSKTSGGSSGGSAAAVADGLAALAQGSDAGGSVRIPASMCGVVGFYPSFGRVPAAIRPDGFSSHKPFLSNGPLARSVEDAALFMDAVSGYHARDPLSHPADQPSLFAATRRGVADFDVAFSPDLGLFAVEPVVRDVVEDAAFDLADAGATVESVSPEYAYDYETLRESFVDVVAVLYATMAANFRDDGIDLAGTHRADVTDMVLDLIERGEKLSAVEFKKTDVARTALFDTFQDLFLEFDLLVTPTLAVPSFDKDSFPDSEIDGQSIDPHYDWYLTWVSNLTGHPTCSVPAGFTSDGLPIGMQIIGRRFRDDDVLAASAAFERMNPWQDAYGSWA